MKSDAVYVKGLVKDFSKEVRLIYPLLLELMNEETAKNVIDESEKQYKALIPQIPYIGGKRNPMSKDLHEAVRLLAFYRSMEPRGFSPVMTYKIIYRAFELKLGKYPKFILRLIGKLQLSSLFKMKLMKLAKVSKLKKYPEDFVFDIVNGDRKSFDWGIEFTECAILKFFKSQNAEELMPFICPNDYITSKFFGLGLSRSMTLAEGSPKCDQYLKRGRETVVKFPSGISV